MAGDLIYRPADDATPATARSPSTASAMKPLPIIWQRLVTQGETCDRCGSTQRALLGAMDQLGAALRPLGVLPLLETKTLDEASFRADPSSSNRIWIAGKPMEAWLGATVGQSPCCTVCGDLPCRTLDMAGNSFEAIPEELIVKVALIAAADLIGSARPPPAPAACCAGDCQSDCL